MAKVKVLVVDDSSIMRKLISKIVSEDPELEVVDTAMNGLFALKKIKKFGPDVVLCDLEMPGMNGIEFLKMRKELGIQTPVIVVSSLGKSQPEIIFKTMSMGASDFIIKPSGAISMDIETLAEEIRSKIHYYHRSNILTVEQKKKIEQEELKHSEAILQEYHLQSVKSQSTPVIPKKSLEEKISKIKKIKAICIGISTGGPNALRKILPLFPKNFPLPIFIVQHMPEGFTKEFASGLDEICKMTAQEARDGLIAKPGNIYIAQGNRHLVLKGSSKEIYMGINQEPHCNGHRPSAGVLFLSSKDVLGEECISIIMTGMGKDGAKEINELSAVGAITIAQSANTCVVYGMPKVAVEQGGIDIILPLDDIVPKIQLLIKEIGI